MTRNLRVLSQLVLLVLVLGTLLGATCGPDQAAEVATQVAPTVNPIATEFNVVPGQATPTPVVIATPPAPGVTTPAATGTPTGLGAAPTAQCEDTGEQALIYSSLPISSPSRSNVEAVQNGIRMAIEAHGGKAGGFGIKYTALDDATAAAQKWTAEQETANANKAIQDGVTAYIGTFNSGAAAVAIPILNEAGIPMVSPANTAINLTLPGPPDPGLFESLYKAGPRNYFRVVPADHLQGVAGANWAKQLGATRVYVLHDQETYGLGLA